MLSRFFDLIHFGNLLVCGTEWVIVSLQLYPKAFCSIFHTDNKIFTNETLIYPVIIISHPRIMGQLYGALMGRGS